MASYSKKGAVPKSLKRSRDLVKATNKEEAVRLRIASELKSDDEIPDKDRTGYIVSNVCRRSQHVCG